MGLKANSILIGLTLVFVSFFYSDVLLNLNRTLFGGTGGDAIKNYWVVDYHLKQDKDFVRFEGVNYPNGEHVVFTDGQIGLTYLLYLLPEGVGIGEYSIAIVNLAMLFSIVVCSYFLYKIYLFYGVEQNWAILFSLIGTFMSPQLGRIIGHFALAYGCVIPILWYLLLVYFKKGKLLPLVLLGIFYCFFSFIHLYYLLIAGGFIFLMLIIHIVFFTRQYVEGLKAILIGVLLPVISVFLFMYLTDDISDRPTVPGGFLFYRANIESIFLPVKFPIIKWWAQNVFPIRMASFEGISYVGISVTVILVAFFYNRFIRKVKVSFDALSSFQISLIASILLLLFSFGLPFIWGMQSLISYLGPIQQFRSIGRFSWPFFYVINVFVFTWFYFRYVKGGVKKGYLYFYLPVFFLSIYEIYLFNSDISKRRFISEEKVFAIENNNLRNLKWGHFQAIYPMPYFWVGSESMDISPNPYLFKEIASIASEKGTPIIGNNLSRVSFTQSMNMLRLVYGEKVGNEMFENYNTKAIIIAKVKHSTLKKSSQSLLKESTYLLSTDDLDYYSINIHNFKNRVVSNIKILDYSKFCEKEIEEGELTTIKVIGKPDNTLLLKVPIPTSLKNWPEVQVKKESGIDYSFSMMKYIDHLDEKSMYFKIPFGDVKADNFEVIVKNSASVECYLGVNKEL